MHTPEPAIMDSAGIGGSDGGAGDGLGGGEGEGGSGGGGGGGSSCCWRKRSCARAAWARSRAIC